jgi:hypothetical protein
MLHICALLLCIASGFFYGIRSYLYIHDIESTYSNESIVWSAFISLCSVALYIVTSYKRKADEVHFDSIEVKGKTRDQIFSDLVFHQIVFTGKREYPTSEKSDGYKVTEEEFESILNLYNIKTGTSFDFETQEDRLAYFNRVGEIVYDITKNKFLDYLNVNGLTKEDIIISSL